MAPMKMLLLIYAAWVTQLPSAHGAMLFDSKNVTEYRIRVPTLKTPNIFKRFMGSAGRKPSKSVAGASMGTSSRTTPLSLPATGDTSTPFNMPKNAGFSSSISYSFPPTSFSSVKGRGPMPVFKYVGPPIWATEPHSMTSGNFHRGPRPPFGNKKPHFTTVKASWLEPGNNKLPEESQNHMKYVVVRAPPDGSHADEDSSLDDARNYRKFHKLKSSIEPEYQIFSIPSKRHSDKRRFLGSQRHMAGSRPTIIRLPSSYGSQGLGPRFTPRTTTRLETSKQFIAEEKSLGNGRNAYIISEVEPNKAASLSSLSSMDLGKNENYNSELTADWSLAISSKKDRNHNLGPNFGSEYGSLLELQNAKQAHRADQRQPWGIPLGAKDKKMSSSSQVRSNIQVLRTDENSKVVIPPGMIAILVPQSFGGGSAGTSITSSLSEFDPDSLNSLFESSSMNKKTIVPLRTSKIEPSKSPAPPYKVDFTHGFPANTISKPDLHTNFQYRMGEEPSSYGVAQKSPSTDRISHSLPSNHQITDQSESIQERIEPSLKPNQMMSNPSRPDRLLPPQKPLSSWSANDYQAYLRSMSSTTSTTTTTSPRIYPRSQSVQKTKPVFLKNHRMHPTGEPYPPVAHDTETAGIYLSRTAASKSNNPVVQPPPEISSFHGIFPPLEH